MIHSLSNAGTFKRQYIFRWKEKYFVLTTDYLQCYKKAKSSISLMGSFSYKVSLFRRSLDVGKKSFLSFLMYFIQHCFICRPSDSTVSEDAGNEPRTDASLALVVRLSNYSAGSHTHTRLDLIHKLGYILSTLS
jgi:hypothetical protein